MTTWPSAANRKGLHSYRKAKNPKIIWGSQSTSLINKSRSQNWNTAIYKLYQLNVYTNSKYMYEQQQRYISQSMP